MTNVQIAVGFWREAGDNMAVLAACEIVGNDLADKIKRLVAGDVGLCHNSLSVRVQEAYR